MKTTSWVCCARRDCSVFMARGSAWIERAASFASSSCRLSMTSPSPTMTSPHSTRNFVREEDRPNAGTKERRDAVHIEEIDASLERGGPARPLRANAGAIQALRFRRADEAAVPGGNGNGDFRDGVLLGRRAEVLGDPRGIQHCRRLRRRPYSEPYLPRGGHRKHRPHRSSAGRLRSQKGELPVAAED